jgi:hypothetical protein
VTERRAPVIVAEDDPFIRIVQVVLDPSTPRERLDAFAHFFEHDEPDFPGWCERLRAKLPGLYPAEVRLVAAQDGLREQLAGADALIVESLEVIAADLDLAPGLRLTQQYGTILSNIDTDACLARWRWSSSSTASAG